MFLNLKKIMLHIFYDNVYNILWKHVVWFGVNLMKIKYSKIGQTYPWVIPLGM
jgi:hypothetical protein